MLIRQRDKVNETCLLKDIFYRLPQALLCLPEFKTCLPVLHDEEKMRQEEPFLLSHLFSQFALFLHDFRLCFCCQEIGRAFCHIEFPVFIFQDVVKFVSIAAPVFLCLLFSHDEERG